ncbi:MAG: PAS domain-containing sensor histidine kinase [Pseudomonadota bacterium]
MIDTRNVTVIWLCAVLAIAIAMASVGLIVLYDVLYPDIIAPGHRHLHPGGGVLSLTLGISLLGVVFRQRWFSTVMAVVVVLLVIGFFLAPKISDNGLAHSLSLNPVLLLITGLMASNIVAAIWYRQGWRFGLLVAITGFVGGLLSLISYWHDAFAMFALGSVAQSTIVAGPLTMLVSIVQPLLARVFHQREEVPYKGLVAVGAASILVTTLCWHVLQVQNNSFLPPLLLFSGLGLSFLVMLSHQFWRESEQRSKSLKALNETLNFHLDQERQLRHTNQRILEFSRDILCSISRDGRFLQISPACEDILGYRPTELLGRPYNELLVPEDQAPSQQEIHLLMTREHTKASGFRNRMIHRNGHVVTISWSAEWSGQEHALFCVGRDISDQLVAETLTRERDQFFSLSPDMFCIVDLNTNFFETNTTFVETLGYSREELIGTSYLDIIHPDDHPAVMEAVGLLLEGNDISELLLRAIDRQGEAHWLNINAILSADDLIYVVARDTTEQRRIEQKLRENEALLKMAERVAMLGGWVVDLNTGKSTWSDAVCSIHDLAPGQAPNVEDALQFYIPEHRERITNAVQTCIETGIPFDEDLQIRTAEGRLRWVRAIGHGVKDNNGEISGLQGALQDITASRLAKEELERSNRELQDFAFVASHDLQEPLRKIQAFSDRLISRSENLDDQEKDYLKRMQSAAGRMQSLIEDLLSYSRVTTQAKPMVACDTGAILGEVLQDMETTISREHAQIDVSELPDTFGDATQLRQVLQNLLSNAIKFHAPDRSPEIAVKAEDVSEDQWTLVVSDKGIGFDERYAQKLFYPFQRLHQKAGYAGTGIGMAIVKKILDRHGATVTVNSKPGEGTTFRIRFSRGKA